MDRSRTVEAAVLSLAIAMRRRRFVESGCGFLVQALRAMTALSTLEAYDLLRHCATLTERIARAEVDQLSRAGLEDEKAWLRQALERVEPLLPDIDALLARCRELPELQLAREDYAQVVQGLWVDALEKLHAALVLSLGSRAPILEALFPHLKFPNLRRATADAVRAYAEDFERRSRMGYVKRILSDPELASVEPLVLELFARLAEWEGCFLPGTLSEADAAPLREELALQTGRIERQMRQARLLAEAALCPVESAFETSGIAARPRRRIGIVDVETPPGMDPGPVDDGVSLVDALGWGDRDANEEMAQEAALQGGSTTALQSGTTDAEARTRAGAREERPHVPETVATGDDAGARTRAGARKERPQAPETVATNDDADPQTGAGPHEERPHVPETVATGDDADPQTGAERRVEAEARHQAEARSDAGTGHGPGAGRSAERGASPSKPVEKKKVGSSAGKKRKGTGKRTRHAVPAPVPAAAPENAVAMATSDAGASERSAADDASGGAPALLDAMAVADAPLKEKADDVDPAVSTPAPTVTARPPRRRTRAHRTPTTTDD